MACGTRRALSTHWLVHVRPAHGARWWTPYSSSALGARALPHSHRPTEGDSTVRVTLMRTPRLLQGSDLPQSDCWEVVAARTLSPVLRRWHRCFSKPSRPSSDLESSVPPQHSDELHHGQEHSVPLPPPPRCARRGMVGGQLPGHEKGTRRGGCAGLSRALGLRHGRGSAAVVKPEALCDLLTAQRARAQRLAALVTAADMAAVEEDHLGLPFQAHDTF